MKTLLLTLMLAPDAAHLEMERSQAAGQMYREQQAFQAHVDWWRWREHQLRRRTLGFGIATGALTALTGALWLGGRRYCHAGYCAGSRLPQNGWAVGTVGVVAAGSAVGLAVCGISFAIHKARRPWGPRAQVGGLVWRF